MKKISDIAEINPHETISKGTLAKKVPMDVLQPFTRDIPIFNYDRFNGGAKFRNGDTIMARITPCLENGKTAQVRCLNEGEIGFGSTEYIVFRAKEGIDPNYLYYLICSPLVRNPAIKSMAGTSGRQRVQTEVVANLQVPVPTYEDQRKIGDLLEKLDNKIQLNKEINKNLEQQGQAVLRHTLETSEDSTMVRLGDYLYIKGRIGWKGLKKSEYLDHSDYRIINGESLTTSGIDWNKAGYISKERYDESPEIMLKIGDILLSKDGTIGKIGYVNQLDSPTSVASGIFVIRNTKPEIISTPFIYYLLKSTLFTAFVAGRTEGSVIPHLYQKDFMEFEFPLPSRNEMRAFDDLIRPQFNAFFANQAENEYLTKVRDMLLPKLMSGEMDVSDINL